MNETQCWVEGRKYKLNDDIDWLDSPSNAKLKGLLLGAGGVFSVHQLHQDGLDVESIKIGGKIIKSSEIDENWYILLTDRERRHFDPIIEKEPTLKDIENLFELAFKMKAAGVLSFRDMSYYTSFGEYVATLKVLVEENLDSDAEALDNEYEELKSKKATAESEVAHLDSQIKELETQKAKNNSLRESLK